MFISYSNAAEDLSIGSNRFLYMGSHVNHGIASF